jgi:hypothetical protein
LRIKRYYLKRDTDEYNISCDAGQAGSFNFDLPPANYSNIATLGDGSITKGNGAFRGRVINATKSFVNARMEDRDTFLDWLTTVVYKDLWLYREFDTHTDRVLVKASPAGGESWKRIKLSDEASFRLISQSPFFTSTTLTTVPFTLTGTGESVETVTLSGFRTPAIYEFTPSSDFELFQIKLQEGYGFRIDRSFNSGEVIEVDTGNSDLTLSIDGSGIFNPFFDTSTPFTLEKGDNDLLVTAQAGTLNVKYYARRF